MYQKVVDESALNQAVTATVIVEGQQKFVRIRPHLPSQYFASQGGSIVLGEAALAALVDLLGRSGLLPRGSR